MSEEVAVKKANIVVRVLQFLGAKVHQTVDVVVDISKDVLVAFYPLLKSEAAHFVTSYKDFGIKVAIEAAKMSTTNKDKIAYFGKTMLEFLKKEGVTEVKEHLVSLLREVVVSELKSKNIL